MGILAAIWTGSALKTAAAAGSRAEDRQARIYYYRQKHRSRGDLAADPGRQGRALLTIVDVAVDKVLATRISKKLYSEYNII